MAGGESLSATLTLVPHPQHASRVLRILGIDDLVEGIVFCDYSNPNFNCKPEPEFYHNVGGHLRTAAMCHTNDLMQAMKVANVSDPAKCYFVDDSLANVKAARGLGWGHCVHFCERGLLHVEGGKPKYIGSDIREGTDTEGIVAVSKLDELRTVWPEIFKH